jgi:hypothetical protein
MTQRPNPKSNKQNKNPFIPDDENNNDNNNGNIHDDFDPDVIQDQFENAISWAQTAVRLATSVAGFTNLFNFSTDDNNRNTSSNNNNNNNSNNNNGNNNNNMIEFLDEEIELDSNGSFNGTTSRGSSVRFNRVNFGNSNNNNNNGKLTKKQIWKLEKQKWKKEKLKKKQEKLENKQKKLNSKKVKLSKLEKLTKLLNGEIKPKIWKCTYENHEKNIKTQWDPFNYRRNENHDNDNNNNNENNNNNNNNDDLRSAWEDNDYEMVDKSDDPNSKY